MGVAILGIGTVLPSYHPDQGFVVNVEDPELAKQRRMMSRGAYLAALAIHQAIQQSPIDPAQTAAFLSVGASAGSMPDLLRILNASTEDQRLSVARFAQKGIAACNPLLAFQLMNNFTLCHAAIREGLQGSNGAFYGGVSHSLSEAIYALRQQPWALAGAADSAHHPVSRREQAADKIPGEAGIALLLAKEGPALAYLETDAQGEDIDPAEIYARFGNCMEAQPALAWWLAIERLQQVSEVRTGGFCFRRQNVSPRPKARPHVSAVITGVGAMSTFGQGISALWQGLVSGQAAFGAAPHLPGFPPTAFVPELPNLGRDRRVACALPAAQEAWRDAGEPSQMALSIGLGLEQAFLEDFLLLTTESGLDWSRDLPGLRYRSPLDLPAEVLKAHLPIHAPTLIHASACAAGTLAVAQAAAWITRGEAQTVLCGAADSMLNPLGLAGLGKLGVISRKNQCRPFDLGRDGILVGEGAAFFVVEAEAAARARGAKIYARIAGWGSTQDAWAPTAPRPGGVAAQRAMAWACAGKNLSDVAYINAHGTGTPANDVAEACAIRGLFSENTPVGSFKGAIGHCMAAAGALELAGCLMAWQQGQLPGTVGFSTPDPQCTLNLLPKAIPFQGRYILKNSFGFGGQNASLLLEAP